MCTLEARANNPGRASASKIDARSFLKRGEEVDLDSWIYGLDKKHDTDPPDQWADGRAGRAADQP